MCYRSLTKICFCFCFFKSPPKSLFINLLKCNVKQNSVERIYYFKKYDYLFGKMPAVAKLNHHLMRHLFELMWHYLTEHHIKLYMTCQWEYIIVLQFLSYCSFSFREIHSLSPATVECLLCARRCIRCWAQESDSQHCADNGKF